MLTKKQTAGIQAVLMSREDDFPAIFQALGDPCRFKIFRVLMYYCDVCVTDIANILGISVPAASQQLRVLERLGLIRKMRKGQMVCYEIRRKNSAVRRLCALLKKVE